MRMYIVIFEQDGEIIATFTTHAADEAAARGQCDAFFEDFSREHPEDTPPRGNDVSIRVELTELHMVKKASPKLSNPADVATLRQAKKPSCGYD